MTNKQKTISLIVSFFILLIISYVFSVKNTLKLKDRVTTLIKEKKMLANAGDLIFNFQQENKYLDSILVRKNISIENSFQQILLQKLNTFSKFESIEIIAFDAPHLFIENNTKLMTYSFEIKGNFRSLLKLINTIERERLGEIKSVNFEKKRNYRNNKKKLTCKFYISKLTQIN